MSADKQGARARDALTAWLISRRRHFLALIDAGLVALALALAYFLRSLDDKTWDPAYGRQFKALLPAVIVPQIALFLAFHLYRGLLRYAGLVEVRVIVTATSLVTFGLFVLNFIAPHVSGLWLDWPLTQDGANAMPIPRTVIAVYWMLTIFLVGGFRFARRMIVSTFRRRDGKNVILVGVQAGEPAARTMLQHPEDGYDPIGFVDPDPLRVGRRIHGLEVLGTLTDLERLVREYAVATVVIALPEATGRQISEIADMARAGGADTRILPTVSGLMRGRVSVSALRPVTIEDILGRDPIQLDLPPELNYIHGKRVLVSGAGGSIGAEIVSQILKLEPEQIILLGRGENSLFEIATRINAGYGDERFPIVVADVRDAGRMRAVFEQRRPHVVFHAAAHKHVPLMEINPEEAVANNIFGTRTLAALSSQFGVERFILISTDKAVRPTNVMGASKRAAEMVVWDEAVRSDTRFVAVRFGNVLGSRGSVIPTLQRQIAAGGPVTLTHRDMRRYFMTIPEAASLVIMAGALAEDPSLGDPDSGPGRLFVLDMGEPVRILDLIHNLITLSGLRPGQDIEIKEIGVRPGEKIHEELLTAGESVKATRFGKIFVTHPDAVDPAILAAALERLRQAVADSDPSAIRSALQELVPDYHPRADASR